MKDETLILEWRQGRAQMSGPHPSFSVVPETCPPFLGVNCVVPCYVQTPLQRGRGIPAVALLC